MTREDRLAIIAIRKELRALAQPILYGGGQLDASAQAAAFNRAKLAAEHLYRQHVAHKVADLMEAHEDLTLEEAEAHVVGDER